MSQPSSRIIIAALHVSLDEFIEGPNGDLDWIETWEDASILRRRSAPVFKVAGRIPATRAIGEPFWPTRRQRWRLRATRLLRARSITRTSPTRRLTSFSRAPRRPESSCSGIQMRRPQGIRSRYPRRIETRSHPLTRWTCAPRAAEGS